MLRTSLRTNPCTSSQAHAHSHFIQSSDHTRRLPAAHSYTPPLRSAKFDGNVACLKVLSQLHLWLKYFSHLWLKGPPLHKVQGLDFIRASDHHEYDFP